MVKRKAKEAQRNTKIWIWMTIVLGLIFVADAFIFRDFLWLIRAAILFATSYFIWWYSRKRK